MDSITQAVAAVIACFTGMPSDPQDITIVATSFYATFFLYFGLLAFSHVFDTAGHVRSFAFSVISYSSNVLVSARVRFRWLCVQPMPTAPVTLIDQYFCFFSGPPRQLSCRSSKCEFSSLDKIHRRMLPNAHAPTRTRNVVRFDCN